MPAYDIYEQRWANVTLLTTSLPLLVKFNSRAPHPLGYRIKIVASYRYRPSLPLLLLYLKKVFGVVLLT